MTREPDEDDDFKPIESPERLAFLKTWEGAERIPQHDAPNAVAVIPYNKNFIEMMDLFRGALKNGEVSARVLELTEDLLAENAANYTVWQHRRECLRALKSDLSVELDFMDVFAEDNPKNYQIWHHRRTVVEMYGNPHREKAFTDKVFQVDAKNYHAWAHRQWVVMKFDLWEYELEYTERLVQEDIRNNSAWNHRWFVVHQGNPIHLPCTTPLSSSVLQQELTYAFTSLETVSKNESAWNYLYGLIRYHPESIPIILDKLLEYDITNPNSLANQRRNERRAHKNGNPSALSMLADVREGQGTIESLNHAILLLDCLQEIDSLRIKYWSRRKEMVRNRLAGLVV